MKFGDKIGDYLYNYYLGKIAGNSQDAVENRASLENSYLARAIISHQILNFIEGPNNHFLIDSIAAHEKNGDVVIRILKYSEIDSLLGMIEGDLTDYNPDTISLSNIKELVASNDEADTNIKSFILNASISDELTGNGNTIQIPEDIYDQARGIINPYHLGLLIDALIALVGDNGVHFESFDEFNSSLIIEPSLIIIFGSSGGDFALLRSLTVADWNCGFNKTLSCPLVSRMASLILVISKISRLRSTSKRSGPVIRRLFNFFWSILPSFITTAEVP
jgi:hypothetical protein